MIDLHTGDLETPRISADDIALLEHRNVRFSLLYKLPRGADSGRSGA